MNFYQDITLLPMADINIYFLWEKIYQMIHLGLVETKMPNGLSPIGLAFPEYDAEKCQLGTKLRVFAMEKQMLEKFNAIKWLNNFSDYAHITGARDVPGNITSYVRFKRKQSKSNTERIARRKAKREGIDLESAMGLLKNHKESLIRAPFIKISSLSSKNTFKLFIYKEPSEELINNAFSCYGLSSVSTLPDF
ncbi:CRISPR-associated endonuclease Cas6/Csy4 [Legionella nautarum]|uniref:CRISPR-associated endonuclease Cas6/Csy4 n=2 Tax=Legionella TaxID=445 RepID=A0A0W0WL36_9GAMM|nr:MULTISPECIES: type I-F CRISPR-associated endoribonuclease Cas6/Csy4 [Legionella]KTC89131.1 CRISPR-associated endonuclease Cas6/Csy4 [Legionella drozanskii LLAP-1]KTD33032.1 CRISPR-associated endonuclease Cas6/Csy4 [Legionella nautarum]